MSSLYSSCPTLSKALTASSMYVVALLVACVFSSSVSWAQELSTECCSCRNTPSSHECPCENPMMASSCTSDTAADPEPSNVFGTLLLAIASSTCVTLVVILIIRIRVIVLVITTILDLVLKLRLRPRHTRRE